LPQVRERRFVGHKYPSKSSNSSIQTRLQEILEIYFLKQLGSMTDLFKLADFAANKSEDEIIQEKKIVFQKYLN
jgi:hypothetical protein